MPPAGCVHGTLSPKPNSGRARIDIEFFAKDTTDEAPIILAIALDERWVIVPIVAHEEWSAGVSARAGASGVPTGDLGMEASLQRTWSRDISDATTVTGGSHFGADIDAGAHTACGWTLLENKQRGTGLPDSVTVAVLVGRQTDKEFSAIVNLEARGSFRTKMDSMFSKIPVDDPVLFNPANSRGQEERIDGEEEDDDDGGGPDTEQGVREGDVGERVSDSKDKVLLVARKTRVTARRFGKRGLGKWKTRMDDLADATFRTIYHDSEKVRF